MNTNGVHIREIELSPELISSFPLSKIRNSQIEKDIAPNLVFIGREVIFKSGTTQIDDFDVTIIADTLNVESSDSKLLVNRTDISADGKSGLAGYVVHILCRDLRGIRVGSRGGQGGRGLPYADGEVAPGAYGQAAEDCTKNQHGALKCTVEMVTPPGRGVQGKPGIKGGSGGQIRLSYVNDFISGGFNLGFLESAGGLGGLGGPGGRGGCTMLAPYVDPDIPTNDPLPADIEKCEGTYKDSQGEQHSYRGPRGKDGDSGLAGDSTPAQATHVSEVDYWASVNNLLGARSQTWAKYRLRVADYYFRAFRPIPDKSHYLSLARDEAAAVLQLGPTEVEAKLANLIRTNIEQQLNVLGLERTAAPLFLDFPRYNQELFDYEQVIRDNFRDAVGGLLEVEVTEQSVREVLEVQRDHLDSGFLKEQIQKEIAAAEAGKKRTFTLLKDAEDRRRSFQKQIKELEDRMSSEPPPGGISLSDGFLLAFGMVAALA